jgi:hypothetical protein
MLPAAILLAMVVGPNSFLFPDTISPSGRFAIRWEIPKAAIDPQLAGQGPNSLGPNLQAKEVDFVTAENCSFVCRLRHFKPELAGDLDNVAAHYSEDEAYVVAQREGRHSTVGLVLVETATGRQTDVAAKLVPAAREFIMRHRGKIDQEVVREFSLAMEPGIKKRLLTVKCEGYLYKANPPQSVDVEATYRIGPHSHVWLVRLREFSGD